MSIMRRSSTINAMSLGSQFKTQLTALVKTIRCVPSWPLSISAAPSHYASRSSWISLFPFDSPPVRFPSLRSTAPHYVRCIKPNDLNAPGKERIDLRLSQVQSKLMICKSPDTFNAPRIVNQLRYSGVLEAVRVARAGYPIRYSHQKFVDQYYMLGGKVSDTLSLAHSASLLSLFSTLGLCLFIIIILLSVQLLSRSSFVSLSLIFSCFLLLSRYRLPLYLSS